MVPEDVIQEKTFKFLYRVYRDFVSSFLHFHHQQHEDVRERKRAVYASVRAAGEPEHGRDLFEHRPDEVYTSDR